MLRISTLSVLEIVTKFRFKNVSNLSELINFYSLILNSIVFLDFEQLNTCWKITFIIAIEI